MSKLYITQLPNAAGLEVARALVAAADVLGFKIGYTGAANVMKEFAATPGALLFGESDDPDVIKAARTALAEAGIQHAVDLPDAALDSLASADTAIASAPEPEAHSVSYNAARLALVCLRLAGGEPHMALHHCILLGNAVGESPDNPHVFHEACAILLDVFPPTIMQTIRQAVENITGLHTEIEDEDGGDV